MHSFLNTLNSFFQRKGRYSGNFTKYIECDRLDRHKIVRYGLIRSRGPAPAGPPRTYSSMLTNDIGLYLIGFPYK